MSNPAGWHRPVRAELYSPAPSLVRSLLLFGAFFVLVAGIAIRRRVTNG